MEFLSYLGRASRETQMFLMMARLTTMEWHLCSMAIIDHGCLSPLKRQIRSVSKGNRSLDPSHFWSRIISEDVDKHNQRKEDWRIRENVIDKSLEPRTKWMNHRKAIRVHCLLRSNEVLGVLWSCRIGCLVLLKIRGWFLYNEQNRPMAVFRDNLNWISTSRRLSRCCTALRQPSLAFFISQLFMPLFHIFLNMASWRIVHFGVLETIVIWCHSFR